MGLVKEQKDIVVPGEVLAEGMDYLPGEGAYRHEQNVIAQQLGILDIKGRQLRIMPLSGKYLPKKGDTILGQVIDINIGGWRVDINSAYSAMLPLKDATTAYIPRGGDLTKYYNFGDWMVSKITNVTGQMLVDLSMKGPGLRKLDEGRIVKVGPSKVPRIIGKQGSMVSMLKQATDTKIIVGQNGICWVSGTPEGELLAIEAIRMIEKNAHVQGLTARVKEFLEEKSGKKLEERGNDHGNDHGNYNNNKYDASNDSDIEEEDRE